MRKIKSFLSLFLSLSLSRVYRNSFLLVWSFSRICNSGNFKEKFFEGSKMDDFKNQNDQIIEFLVQAKLILAFLLNWFKIRLLLNQSVESSL